MSDDWLTLCVLCSTQSFLPMNFFFFLKTISYFVVRREHLNSLNTSWLEGKEKCAFGGESGRGVRGQVHSCDVRWNNGWKKESFHANERKIHRVNWREAKGPTRSTLTLFKWIIWQWLSLAACAFVVCKTIDGTSSTGWIELVSEWVTCTWDCVVPLTLPETANSSRERAKGREKGERAQKK